MALGDSIPAEPAAAPSSARVETPDPSPELRSTFEIQIVAEFTEGGL
ncbi:MAG: hypothetical protein AAEJ52_17765 [Myxococcota bacterium]|jgi:hypothetical protein